MKAKELEKLLKTKEPQEIISDYMNCKLYLTDRQLTKVINLKNGTNAEGHGGTCWKYENTRDKRRIS